jgi:hypothetical protein
LHWIYTWYCINFNTSLFHSTLMVVLKLMEYDCTVPNMSIHPFWDNSGQLDTSRSLAQNWDHDNGLFSLIY